MDYDKGEIIKKSNIKFKGTHKLDFRIGGHPVVLPIETKDENEFLYFLTFSSRDDLYVNEPDRYLLVAPDKYNKLRKTSIIDLKYIYKEKNANTPPMGILNRRDYTELIRKFNTYQADESDEYYDEIRTFLGDTYRQN